ncbi:transposase [Kaarinaea lacus]
MCHAKIKSRRHSPEFKQEAIRRSCEDGITDQQVSEELGISAQQLARWRDEFRLLGNDVFPGQGHSIDAQVNPYSNF